MDWQSFRPAVDAYAQRRISWEELVDLGAQWMAGKGDLSAALPVPAQQRVIAFVRAHPGCTTRELADALCLERASNWISYLRSAGRIRTQRAGGRLRLWLVELAPGVSRAPRAGVSGLTPTQASAAPRRRQRRG